MGRDFEIDPVNIYEVGFPYWFRATDKDLQACDIPCRSIFHKAVESATVTHWDARTEQWPSSPLDNKDYSHGFLVLRNTESPVRFGGLAIERAHRAGYNIVMTSELASDVPIPYVGRGSALDIDIFAPALPFEKKRKAAMAVISNCGGKTFRLQAVAKMQELGIQVDMYGRCMHNKDFQDDVESTDPWWNQKIVTARTYMFYLTFENSRWPDYVTEKLYHVLTAGSVPVVIGAPNIADYMPSPKSYLYLDSLEDVPAVVERMKFLMQNRSAYEAMLAWKQREAPNSFKAIADISGVHHTCQASHVGETHGPRFERHTNARHRPPVMREHSKDGTRNASLHYDILDVTLEIREGAADRGGLDNQHKLGGINLRVFKLVGAVCGRGFGSLHLIRFHALWGGVGAVRSAPRVKDRLLARRGPARRGRGEDGMGGCGRFRHGGYLSFDLGNRGALLGTGGVVWLRCTSILHWRGSAIPIYGMGWGLLQPWPSRALI
ncbi:Putative fucosyltransferase [Klebsormidium nitens]|uniref:Fucosyltransferase n=1 Tax=Klebsormidium nitens TaxID=105231 RepID=A0A1Y1IPT5_KLENI|nr:Putative fucosyltransferase [Klebsormidium nitens]|eukprot:GAQ92935.1 Putative fucosyltransferase [Klebsormidium nitens]